MKLYPGSHGLTFLDYDEFLRFSDTASAVRYLKQFGAHMAELRELLTESGCDAAQLTDDAVVNQLATLLVSGRVLVPRVWFRNVSTAEGAEETKATPPGPPHRPPPKLHWVEFRVVDDETGLPIEGIELNITLPDGRTETRKTDFGGFIEINDTLMGACTVRCDLNSPRSGETWEYVHVE